jgi:hypothetical protein
MNDNLAKRVQELERQLSELREVVYKNNFTSSQDFNKYSRFNSRLKVPNYTSNPTIGEVGDIIEVGGKLKICTTASTTAPTWTIVGLQV